METPFTVEQFFGVFARYNQSVWPMQIILNLLALATIVLLCRARPSGSRVISGVLSFFWGWMAIAYHFVFFTGINPAAWLFGAVFLIGALWFAWFGVLKGRLLFRSGGGKRGWAGGLLMGYALLVYPLLSHFLGHRYPAAPTFGLPCPTTIFTLGMLLFAVAPLPRSVFVVPLLWAAVGSTAAFQFGVLQDLGLLVAGPIGLVAMIATPAPSDSTPTPLRRNQQPMAERRWRRIAPFARHSSDFSGRSRGNRMTSRMERESVSNMVSRSMPIPSPPVGGMP